MKNKLPVGYSHIGYFLFLGLLLGILFSGCDTRSETERGEMLYNAYCQMCHGDHGNGSMADMLTTPPPDLTQISARRGGKFPTDEIVEQVSGRKRLLGHGESDMPVFWVAIKNGENLQSDEEVEERIDALVAYLKSIQE